MSLTHIPNNQTRNPANFMTEIPPVDELPSRWEIELEFVQSLANTQYLMYLSQQGCFKDETFLNYLNYLNYWKDPQYSKFLVYPDCLHILTLLQNENFRIQLLNQNFTSILYNDMVDYWREPLIKDEKEKDKRILNGVSASPEKVKGETVEAGASLSPEKDKQEIK